MGDGLHHETVPAKAEQPKQMVVDGGGSGRKEMCGLVRIPDTWGKERYLKEWKDSSIIDQSLFPAGIMSARKALVEECRRSNSTKVSINYSC